MQIIINTQSLTKALAKIGIATHCTTLPILSCVKLDALDDSLTLSATDLDLYVTEKIAAGVKTSGSTLVAYKLLNAFVARATAKEVRMMLKGDGKTLTVYHGEHVAHLETLSEEFPTNHPLDDAKKIKCDAIELVKPLKKVAHAMSTDTGRYALLGVNINTSNEKKSPEVAATDSRRVSMCGAALKLEDIDVIVPRVGVEAITSVFAEGGEATLSFTTTVIALATESSEVRCKLLEAKFPNYRQVIPEVEKKARFFSAIKKDLLDAITTASLFLSSKEIAVRIEGKGKELEIGCYDRFQSKVMGTELEGQPKMTKHVNYRYILDVLEVLELDNVRIEVKDELPIVIRENAFVEVINSLIVDAPKE